MASVDQNNICFTHFTPMASDDSANTTTTIVLVVFWT